MRILARFALIAVFAFGLSAARITLRDGTVVYGQFVSGSPQSIVVQDQDGMRHRFDVNQVQTIDFGEQRRDNGNDRDRQFNDPQPPPPQSRNYGDRFATLQAGTQISVRTDEKIDSANAGEGRTFSATIGQDVLDQNGRIAIPRGSQAILVIRRVNEGGAVSNGSFILDLDSVRVNNRTYLVASSDVKASDANGLGANRRTGEMVGGGAVLGTLLGAIAGGGKGAAIGAAAGAAAGGGVEVLTKGHEIRVPAETMLNFRLDQPLDLREAR
jgi:hypothetical protein